MAPCRRTNKSVDRERHPGRAAWRELRCEGLRFWIARASSSTIVFCASRKDSGSHRRAGSRSRKDTTILPELEKAHNFRVAGKTPLTDMPAHVRFLGEVAGSVLERPAVPSSRATPRPVNLKQRRPSPVRQTPPVRSAAIGRYQRGGLWNAPLPSVSWCGNWHLDRSPRRIVFTKVAWGTRAWLARL